MQPPNEAPVTIFAIIIILCYRFLDSLCSLEMTITRCHYVRGMPDRVGHDDGKVGQGTFGRMEVLCVGNSRELVQVVAQA